MTTKKTAKQAEIEREAKIAKYKQVNCFVKPTKTIDSGAAGKAFELQCTKATSTKSCVAGKGKIDNHFTLNGKRTPVEIKTNGGRIGGLLSDIEKGKDTYIIYQLNICNANTSHILRYIEPKIFKGTAFLDLVKSTGAYRHNSRDNEPCIQCSSKKFYKALLDYNTVWDVNKNYTDEDFKF